MRAARRGDSLASDAVERGELSRSVAFRRGLASDLLNVKVGLFWTALVPQFVGAESSALLPVAMVDHVAAVDAAPSAEVPAEMVADKGYHSRETLKSLDDGPWKTRIAEPKRDGFELIARGSRSTVCPASCRSTAVMASARRSGRAPGRSRSAAARRPTAPWPPIP